MLIDLRGLLKKQVTSALLFLSIVLSAFSAFCDHSTQLSCFFYDKVNPHEGINALHPGLPSVFAKGIANENIYVSGELRDGFFKIQEMFGSFAKTKSANAIKYDNSFAIGMALCQRALERAFPTSFKNKEISHMGIKASFLATKLIPVIFNQQETKFIKHIDKLVVFGDSLSDQGNLKSKLRIYPKIPYFAGRFSNHQIWVDYFQKMTGIAVQNWAVGGCVSEIFAETKNSHRSFFEKLKSLVLENASGSLTARIDHYIKESLTAKETLKDPDTTLFALWVGANDYINILDKKLDVDLFLDSPQNTTIGYFAVVERVTDTILKNLARLYSLGARNFLVANIPDLGRLPKILNNKAYHSHLLEAWEKRILTLSKKMTEVTLRHNHILESKLQNFYKKYHNINLAFIDSFTGFEDAFNNINFKDRVIKFNDGSNRDLVKQICWEHESVLIFCASYPSSTSAYKKAKCKDSHRALFFDGLHPSSFGHCLISSYIHQKAAEMSFFNVASVDEYLKLCPQ